MKDLNFFEPYIEKREFKFQKIYLLYGILVLSVIAIGGISIKNLIQINSLEKDVAARKVIAEDPKTVAKVEEIKALENEVNTFREEVNKIVELDKSIESRDLIGEEFLKEIKSKMPGDLFLSNFSAHNREIQISGIAKDTYSIAEFGKGLEQLEVTNSSFISNITNVEDYYTFAMNLTLKDVMIDGEDSIQEQEK